MPRKISPACPWTISEPGPIGANLMQSQFLIPIIVWLPQGYDSTIVMPDAELGQSLEGGRGRIRRSWKVVADGETVKEEEDILRFKDGRLVEGPPAQVTWRATDGASFGPNGAFMEYAIDASDDETWFSRNHLPTLYNVFSSKGRKSYIACHSWKFGSPQVISQIATFGRYVDAYPVIHIDRERDLGDSLVLINPYRKAIMARVYSPEDGTPPRIKIEPECTKLVRLDELFAKDRERWTGQIQLSANNRIVTYIVKHSLTDPNQISTVEHLDPYRADPTHFPLSQWLRLRYGAYQLKRRSIALPAPN